MAIQPVSTRCTSATSDTSSECRSFGELASHRSGIFMCSCTSRQSPIPKKFQQEKFSLYRYATRLLLERVSWLCRDYYRPADGGDGRAELIFSNRSAMSYADLRDYLRRLRNSAEVRIHWDSVEPDSVSAVAHEQLAGLQIADAVATGAFYSVHRSVYGETEDGYLRLLARNIYRNRGSADGYGLKFWGADAEEKRRVLAVVAN